MSLTSVPTLAAMVRAYVARHPTALCEEGRVALKDVLARCTELDAAVGHVRAFCEMLTGRLGCHAPTASPRRGRQGPGLFAGEWSEKRVWLQRFGDVLCRVGPALV
jgi:hypothetical protein